MAKAKINPEFTYKTRGGQDVKDVRFNNDDYCYPVYAEVGSLLRSYTIQGYYYDAGNISDLDLIKQPVKKPKPVVKEVQKEVMKNASTSEVVKQDVLATQHIHHDMIVAWAKNPKLEFQWKDKRNGQWHTERYPNFIEEYEWRFKPEEPKFLTITGADGKSRSYPEPCKVKLDRHQGYFLSSVSRSSTEYFDEASWFNDVCDNAWLEKGLVHLTKEAAELHAKAMLGID